jgi:hypothetical protein
MLEVFSFERFCFGVREPTADGESVSFRPLTRVPGFFPFDRSESPQVDPRTLEPRRCRPTREAPG